MLEQKAIVDHLQMMVNDKTVVFPKFIIFVGMKGAGKKTLADRLYKMITRSTTSTVNKYVLEDNKVETIRAMIADAKEAIDPTIYIMPDADKMSTSAKNTLLKITEEPPANAWFIMTMENENNTLTTVRSRAQIFKFAPYSAPDIVEYAKERYGVTSLQEIEIIADICETPGEVDYIVKNGIISLYDYVSLVVDNIAECNCSNSFKIADKIALKDEEDKFDLRLFWKSFMKVCADRMRETRDIKYADGIKITSKYMQQLNVTGISKASTFDLWILAIRESWV